MRKPDFSAGSWRKVECRMRLLPLLAVAVLSAFPVAAQEMPAQTPQSREQVEKFVSRWQEHFKGAGDRKSVV